jgi:hypothetical protein
MVNSYHELVYYEICYELVTMLIHIAISRKSKHSMDSNSYEITVL